ncbi:hypothetical protein [Kitasatospora cheerisanensis]|uniref:Uncharacterized protein n=1 Tax=Kitasatospora cheerisanensis KCTC 2395 TaxID=1348663 RepID=A0A066YW10_9ACTN|nr:hypothetical protein [Kitasatospora cheerisanensis]KDN85698.1 hypothetical protein KCH_25260 [Kitasatospora cheerisanensis KCTC 2395]
MSGTHESTLTVLAEIRGPAHHLPAVMESINNMTALFPAEVIAGAFGMVEHSVSIAWATRPDAFLPLTFTQFHQLVRDRYYADLYRRALGLGADFDQIGDMAADIALALLNDPQLTR